MLWRSRSRPLASPLTSSRKFHWRPFRIDLPSCVHFALDDHLAFDDNTDPAADFLDLLELMRREHDGQTMLAIQILDHFQNADGAVGIDAESGFVEKHRYRIFNQNLGDAEALLHAAGKLLDQAPAVVGETDLVQDFGGFFARLVFGNAIQPRHVKQIFSGADVVVKAGILRQVTDPPFHLQATLASD